LYQKWGLCRYDEAPTLFIGQAPRFTELKLNLAEAADALSARDKLA
jgi:hypothetical protein